MPWRDLLPRLRFVDLGPGATFGQRHVARVEGFEVCCSRPSDGGPPVLHVAAALLHLIGVKADTPTWQIAEMMRERGVGAPYGPREGVDLRAVDDLFGRAREMAAKGAPQT